MNLNDILQKKGVTPALVGVASFSIGAASGYFLGQYLIKRKVREMLEEQVEATPILTYSEARTMFVDEFELPSAPDSDEIVEDEVDSRMLEHEEPEEEPIQIVNVFTEPSTWDYEAELSTRTKDQPYVIHQEEFMADEMGFHQETLTYYAADDIIADTDDTPIYDYRLTVGDLPFGHGSNDKNVVYKRNEAIHMEWEILYSDGSFAEEVLGLQFEKQDEHELKHSYRKFRPQE